jgi:hypothetical protein
MLEQQVRLSDKETMGVMWKRNYWNFSTLMGGGIKSIL